MQPIHVKRYNNPAAVGYQGSVEPDDRSWIVFIDNEGLATLWRRVESKSGAVYRDGKVIEPEKVDHSYVDVELPTAFDSLNNTTPMVPPHPPSSFPGPLDYTVEPGVECFGDALSPADHARERAAHPEAKHGFYAKLSHRAIMCWGETEHEAVRYLMNYVACLCTAGSMDHTGKPMAGNQRRSKAVWGE